MLKRLIHRAIVEMNISPVDPLLIKSGQATVTGVDMAFVKTYRFGQQAVPYIPGSSLKGVIRSYGEKICRSLRENPVPVCLPYLKPGEENKGEEDQASCGLRIEAFLKKNSQDAISSADAYRLYCPACRIFGSHQFMGRLATSDANLSETDRKERKWLLENRDGVAIDRMTGGAAGGAKYDLEVLTAGTFQTRVELQNFERWQLGLLGLILRDMSEGLVRIGMGKSRGLGRIKVDLARFDIISYGQPMATLRGLAGSCSQAEIAQYGLFPETGTGGPLPKATKEGLRFTHDILDQWQMLLEPGLTDFLEFIRQAPWPQDIDAYTERRR